LVDIRCWKCGGKSSGDTINEARSKLNHAVGLSRGIPCGDNYNCIEEIKSTIPQPTIASISPPKDYVIKTDEASYQNVEGKSNENVTVDEAKQSTKNKSKKFSY